jgi:uncharacterized protein YndB with AHSA1/START domain
LRKSIHEKSERNFMAKAGQTKKGKALIISRIFDAPRELVWKAWTETELVMRWWGPEGFTAPVVEIDLRVGGKYLYAMRSDGKDSGLELSRLVLERIVTRTTFQMRREISCRHRTMP